MKVHNADRRRIFLLTAMAVAYWPLTRVRRWRALRILKMLDESSRRLVDFERRSLYRLNGEVTFRPNALTPSKLLETGVSGGENPGIVVRDDPMFGTGKTIALGLTLATLRSQRRINDKRRRMAGVLGFLVGRRRASRLAEWRADLFVQSGLGRYFCGLLWASLKMRARDAGRWILGRLCWALASDLRTWGILSVMLIWGGVDTAADSGLGSAILTVLASIAGLAAGTHYLRRRWGVEVKPRKKPRM